jgi:hypothetical protein
MEPGDPPRVNAHVDLKIFHYHFLTGGVSTVVRQAVEAFHKQLPAIRSLELVAAAIPGEFRGQIRQHAGTCTEMPEIGYRQQGDELSYNDSKPDHDQKYVAREAKKLAQRLLCSFGSDDSVWWVHNYHLGKNVVFTQALLEIIHSGRPQRMILQIHDFPECGRFGNLGMLKTALTLDPYPVSPWVRYAVLNRRDREVLIRAGIPEQDVFLLENPVFRRSDPGPDKTIRSKLKRLFEGAFPRFDPRAPLLFYPIRTIRRKNALEAMLLCLLLDRRVNILITLPGTSVSERRYSDLVEQLFADRICPGLWGIGTEVERQGVSFDDLVAASDLVLSTSVQEGFGYLFINSLLWALPLAARDLDSLAGLKDLFHGYPAYFYDTIRVPVSDPPTVAEAYRSKIEELSTLIPKFEQERLLAEIEQLVRNNRVDFSYLPVEAQEKLLRKIVAADGPELRICRSENRITLGRIDEMLTMEMERAADVGTSKLAEVDRRFGAAAYAAGFRRILDSFGTGSRRCRQGKDEGIAAGVLKAFLKLERLRLLYDY